MNSCVFVARILGEPELRYTPENTPLTQITVEVPALREGDPASQLKAIGWGDSLSQEIQQNYHDGDQVILAGRLTMNTVERPEGFKEKKAELVISQIQALGAGLPAMNNTSPSYTSPAVAAPVTPSNVVPINPMAAAPTPASVPSEPEPNLDDIPF
ncbi:single-stranded DNA-binding protein [[Synechococcus] sp. NIES-970]|uniref:single-stranded DNA-binding protein n=1 Tax=Picosynechococcus sp. NKBG15041c TaxID=1407650 RepID=UPI000423D245|nr:single-stranded DNA-binding protein [Picosynechococcus sp. NKBG15041c]BAW95861.1 single-stranded DNA-binding protein [[Synechococcus] sp. NIES-970]